MNNLYKLQLIVIIISVLYSRRSNCQVFDQRDHRYTPYQKYEGCIGTFCEKKGTLCHQSFGIKAHGYQSTDLFSATSNRCIMEDGNYGRSYLCCERNSTEGKWIKDHGAKFNEYPFIVAIIADYRPTIRKMFSCSASIYNKNYILTSSHCIVDRDTGILANKVTVTVGASHLLQEHDPQRIFIATKRRGHLIKHEDYNITTLDNDIALLKLDKPIPQFNAYVQPLRMAEQNEDPLKSKLGLPLGYGKGPFGYSAETIWGYPLALNIPDGKSGKRTECEKLAGYRELDHQTKICVGGQGTGGIGMGHSGGPLVCFDTSGKPYQCGVSSFSVQSCTIATDCADRLKYPSVYTNLAYYADWIEEITNGEKQNEEETMTKLKYIADEGQVWSKRRKNRN